jgi:hypothetical protein
MERWHPFLQALLHAQSRNRLPYVDCCWHRLQHHQQLVSCCRCACRQQLLLVLLPLRCPTHLRLFLKLRVQLLLWFAPCWLALLLQTAA